MENFGEAFMRNAQRIRFINDVFQFAGEHGFAHGVGVLLLERDEIAAAGAAVNDAFVFKYLIRFGDSVRVNAQFHSQFAHRGQAVAVAIPPEHGGDFHLFHDLQIDRNAAFKIDFHCNFQYCMMPILQLYYLDNTVASIKAGKVKSFFKKILKKIDFFKKQVYDINSSHKLT